VRAALSAAGDAPSDGRAPSAAGRWVAGARRGRRGGRACLHRGRRRLEELAALRRDDLGQVLHKVAEAGARPGRLRARELRRGQQCDQRDLRRRGGTGSASAQHARGQRLGDQLGRAGRARSECLALPAQRIAGKGAAAEKLHTGPALRCAGAARWRLVPGVPDSGCCHAQHVQQAGRRGRRSAASARR